MREHAKSLRGDRGADVVARANHDGSGVVLGHPGLQMGIRANDYTLDARLTKCPAG